MFPKPDVLEIGKMLTLNKRNYIKTKVSKSFFAITSGKKLERLNQKAD